MDSSLVLKAKSHLKDSHYALQEFAVVSLQLYILQEPYMVSETTDKDQIMSSQCWFLLTLKMNLVLYSKIFITILP